LQSTTVVEMKFNCMKYHDIFSSSQNKRRYSNKISRQDEVINLNSKRSASLDLYREGS